MNQVTATKLFEHVSTLYFCFLTLSLGSVIPTLVFKFIGLPLKIYTRDLLGNQMWNHCFASSCLTKSLSDKN